MNIISLKKENKQVSYLTISVLGKSLKLNIIYSNNTQIELIQNETSIDLLVPKKYKNMDNMNIINLSVQKLYSTIAKKEIEYAMDVARHLLKFAPEDYQIKRIENNFCVNSKNKIIVNPDIVKFNRDIINTTIIQAFCKLKYKTNSKQYKNLLNLALEKYDLYKKDLTYNLKLLKVC